MAAQVNPARQLTCFGCGKHFIVCGCEGLDHGEDMQYCLPQPDGTLRENIDFWSSLVVRHPASQTFDAERLVADLWAKGLPRALQTGRAKFDPLWRTYRASSDLASIVGKLQNLWTLEQLQRVGDEAVGSFFTGRWVELTTLGITLFMNTLGKSPLDPKDPANADLWTLVEAIKFVNVVIEMISSKHGYTLVARSSHPRTKAMAIFEPLLVFP
eukprot:jgi/Mesvir1/27285/Mv07118-RA.1